MGVLLVENGGSDVKRGRGERKDVSLAIMSRKSNGGMSDAAVILAQGFDLGLAVGLTSV